MNLVHNETTRPSDPTKVAAQAPPGIDDAATRAVRPGPRSGVESVDARSPCISEVPTGPTPIGGPGAALRPPGAAALRPAENTLSTMMRSATTTVGRRWVRTAGHIRPDKHIGYRRHQESRCQYHGPLCQGELKPLEPQRPHPIPSDPVAYTAAVTTTAGDL